MGRSFGGSGGGMGGGGSGMLRTVQRAVRAGVGGAAQDPFSHSANSSSSGATTTTTGRPTHNSKTSTALSLSPSSTTSSSPFSSFIFPISASSALPTWPASSSPTSIDVFEWEYVGGNEDEKACSFYDDFVFGSVPSTDEVQSAVSALHQVLDPTSFSQFIKGRFSYSSDMEDSDELASSSALLNRVSSAGKELDWIEPSLQLCNSRMLQRHGFDRVYDAFHLLRTEPSIQRMVMSLSSDKAVWDAVMNNEVVRELRESLTKADSGVPENPDGSSDGSNAATDILRWIFNNTKAKLMELMEKITMLVNELFKPQEDKNTKGAPTDLFEEKLRTSFMLSIVVLLIVVVSRARMA